MKDYNEHPGDSPWRAGAVHCAVLPSGEGTVVELCSENDGVFLRRLAPNMAARNEAEYPRLLPRHESAPRDDSDSDCPDAVLANACLPTLLVAASRPPIASTA